MSSKWYTCIVSVHLIPRGNQQSDIKHGQICQWHIATEIIQPQQIGSLSCGRQTKVVSFARITVFHLTLGSISCLIRPFQTEYCVVVIKLLTTN